MVPCAASRLQQAAHQRRQRDGPGAGRQRRRQPPAGHRVPRGGLRPGQPQQQRQLLQQAAQQRQARGRLQGLEHLRKSRCCLAPMCHRYNDVCCRGFGVLLFAATFVTTCAALVARSNMRTECDGTLTAPGLTAATSLHTEGIPPLGSTHTVVVRKGRAHPPLSANIYCACILLQFYQGTTRGSAAKLKYVT
jgi:hypothetical protein